MSSHLSRLIFRRILSSKPITHRECLVLSLTTASRIYNADPIPPTQKRSLFGFSRQKTRRPKDVDIDPGFEKMMELSNMQRLSARPPPPKELAEAFKKFFDAKYHGHKEPVQDIQAAHALATFEHLRGLDQPCKPWVESFTLQRVLSALKKVPKDKGENHVKLAALAYTTLEDRFKALEKWKHEDEENLILARQNYAKVLSKFGKTLKAREFVLSPLDSENPHISTTLQALQKQSPVWKAILQGFVEEDNEIELLRTVEILRERQLVEINPTMLGLLTRFFAGKGNLEQTKIWYNQLVESGGVVYPAASILQCCLKHNDLEWGKSILQTVLTQLQGNAHPKLNSKTNWDAIVLWSAWLGNGVEDTERAIAFMNGRGITADADTINQLVEFAQSQNNPYLAERYYSLGLKLGIPPNSQTYLLQSNYRLSHGDIQGSLEAYRQLRMKGINGDEDLPVANKLIRAMCSSSRFTFEQIMALVDDVSERQIRFEPETVAALVLLHLSRDELHDIIDLMTTHAYHFSIEQRETIRDAFLSFIFDRNRSVTQVWDAYQIMQQVFRETPREIRTTIMAEFYSRSRPDMAVHVFNHMRQHPLEECRAAVNTYVAALEGVAKTEDEEGLEVVHNQFKLDFNIEPNTKLRNALMLAYTMCGMPRRAMKFWYEIAESKEGPDHNSLMIAFRACELNPFGERDAKPLWQLLLRMDVEITKEMLAAYIGALAGNQLFEDADRVLNTCEKEFGIPPDKFLIGTYFNATRGVTKQQRVEVWIKTNRPDLWDELEKEGIVENEYGLRDFKNVDRTLRA